MSRNSTSSSGSFPAEIEVGDNEDVEDKSEDSNDIMMFVYSHPLPVLIPKAVSNNPKSHQRAIVNIIQVYNKLHCLSFFIVFAISF